MIGYRAKFDADLRDIHTSFLDVRRGDRDRAYPLHPQALHGGPVSLLLMFDGDLAEIESSGFRTQWADGRLARGDVELADLEAVASRPGVVRLEYGSRLRPMLDTSAVEINARGTSLANAVWTVNTTSGAFTGNQGTGVLIGVIDSGIDFRHPVFLQSGVTTATRIKRIWDMGIDPHDGIGRPAGFAYGIEYTEQMINDVLQKKPGAKPVKHNDCFGHGNHVASIAAGDGRAEQARKKFEFVGVAPAAGLVIVKMFHLFSRPEQNGVALPFERLFEDAITYVLRVAKNDLGDPPVVLNASLGKEIGPHDGLSASDQLIEARFRNATRTALVAAAGNEADSRQHAVVTVPAGGSIDVPFTMYDERTVKSDTADCTDRPRPNAASELEIQFWYRKLGPQQTLTAGLTLPAAKTRTTGPVLGGPDVDGKYRTKFPFRISHAAETTQRPPANTPVTRNLFRVSVKPVGNGFGTGSCTLRVTAPAGTVIHVWGRQDFPPQGFRLGHDKPGSVPAVMLPLPAGVTLDDASTLSYPATSAGAIAVASYDDTDPQHALASTSAHGPLVDYSGSGPYVAKPDLAAPGVAIEAAISGGGVLRKLLKLVKGAQYAALDGTSMATPHVSGVAALMFEKNGNLSRADLVTKLKANARPPQQADTFGAGRVDAKKSRDAA